MVTLRRTTLIFLLIIILGISFLFTISGCTTADSRSISTSDGTDLSNPHSSASSSVTSSKTAASNMEIDFHKLTTNSTFKSFLKLQSIAISEQRRELYVSSSAAQAILVINIDTDTVKDIIDVPYGAWALSVGADGYLYNFRNTDQVCMKIDIAKKKVIDSSLNHLICECIMDSTKCDKMPEEYKSAMPSEKRNLAYGEWNGYTFEPVSVDRTSLNGKYTVVGVKDSNGNTLGNFAFGPDALFFKVDTAKGKLYGSSTGDGSISVFDLTKLESTNYCENNKCLMKKIDIGTSVDSLIVDSKGNIYIRNRLGGSTIYKYSLGTGKVLTIDNENSLSGQKAIWASNGWNSINVDGGIGMWPVGMALSNDESKLYVLSHYGVLIDIVDASSGKVINTIKFSTSEKPSKDALGEMTLDRKHETIYAVWPELGIIGIADVKHTSMASVVGTIDLTTYGFNKDDVNGPARVTLAVNEEQNKLYAYMYNEQKLLVFDAVSLEKEDELSIKIDGREPGMLRYNNITKKIYLANIVIDPSALSVVEKLNSESIILAIGKQGELYVKEAVKDSSTNNKQETVYLYKNGTFMKEWQIGQYFLVPSSFFFDFKNNALYAGRFEEGAVVKFSLVNGNATKHTLSSAEGRGSQPQNGQGNMQGTAGKCGDGNCDEVEQKNPSICPIDCGNVSSPASSQLPQQPRQVQTPQQTSTQRPQQSQTRGACGDGNCDEVEQQLGKCPEDCNI